MVAQQTGEQLSGSRPTRNAALDLVKWLALAAMVIDHLRFAWPTFDWVVVPGRVAFPLFALALAANVVRQRPGALFTGSNGRYLGLLLVFGIVSQPIYHAFIEPGEGNILFTLAAGLVIALCVRHLTHQRWRIPVITASIVGAIILGGHLSYGASGILLPTAFLLALQRGPRAWWIPALTAIMANQTDFMTGVIVALRPIYVIAERGEFIRYLQALSAGASALMGLWLLRSQGLFRKAIWPVTGWAYAFYPAHLLSLLAASVLSSPFP